MENKNLYIISTRNMYERDSYDDIFAHVLGASKYVIRVKERVFGDRDFRTYWTLAAYVTKDQELKIRDLVKHSKFPNWKLQEGC